MTDNKPTSAEKTKPNTNISKSEKIIQDNKTDLINKETARFGNTLAIAVTLTIIISVATAGYFVWNQTNKSQQQLISQTSLNQSTLNAIQPKVQELQTTTKSLQNKIDTTNQELESVLNNNKTVMSALETLQTNIGKESPNDWVLAEVEYLMRIANNRLQLERDIGTATAALIIADQRLLGLGQPKLLDVRRQLADEITALGAIIQPDISGSSLTLSSLQDRVEQLPVKGSNRSQSMTTESSVGPDTLADTSLDDTGITDTGNWKLLLNETWNALKGLVSIRRNDQSDTPLLAPEQRDFLRLNMQLKLESARLALLKGNDQNYHDSLETAQAWLLRYFDPEATTSINMIHAISQLNEINLSGKLPDISGSLATLKKLLIQKPSQTTNMSDSANDNPPTPVAEHQATQEITEDTAEL